MSPNSSGKVQVCGDSPQQIFCTLNVGVAFGEISLLAMGEGPNLYSIFIQGVFFSPFFQKLSNKMA